MTLIEIAQSLACQAIRRNRVPSRVCCTHAKVAFRGSGTGRTAKCNMRWLVGPWPSPTNTKKEIGSAQSSGRQESGHRPLTTPRIHTYGTCAAITRNRARIIQYPAVTEECDILEKSVCL